MGKSAMQFCVQGTFNCAQDDERGETDARWLTLDELVEADCSREEFNAFCVAYVKVLQETMKKDAKRFKSVVTVYLVCLVGAGYPRCSRPTRSRTTGLVPSWAAGGGA